ncbi:MAG: hypothetical protein M1833_001811 [Piccolia ochrophora]|nr:MAG: hypothetical protein M1833_001811 [Piccolia ochrophora]
MEESTPTLAGRYATDYKTQAECPLFTRIPGEIRNLIFHFALLSDDDKTRPYPATEYYCRPGYRYHQRIHTDLLSTCRLIYLEAHTLPLAVNEHVMWRYRGPEDHPENDWSFFENRFTSAQLAQIKRLHCFTQQFWLQDEDWALRAPVLPNLTHLKVTLRHTDWWNWESGNELELTRDQIFRDQVSPTDAHSASPEDESPFYALSSLREFALELETIERNKPQLDVIVADASTWTFRLPNRVLTTEGVPVTTYRWKGPSKYHGYKADLAEGSESADSVESNSESDDHANDESPTADTPSSNVPVSEDLPPPSTPHETDPAPTTPPPPTTPTDTSPASQPSPSLSPSASPSLSASASHPDSDFASDSASHSTNSRPERARADAAYREWLERGMEYYVVTVRWRAHKFG